MLRVVAGKGDNPRETLIPPTLTESIRTVGDVRNADIDEPIIDKSTPTLRRWATNHADLLAEETDDERWSFLSSTTSGGLRRARSRTPRTGRASLGRVVGS